MTDNKIVWVASMPRAGSMCVYNITRKLLQHGGKDVHPQSIPKTDEQMFALADQALQGNDSTDIYVLKVHAAIRPEIPGSLFITTVRDVRDAMVSWMRFMHSDFDKALTTAEAMTGIIDHYRNFPGEKTLQVDYGNITGSPLQVCADIARFLSINIFPAEINSIVDMYSKDNVAKRINKIEHFAPENELIRNFDGSVRAYDSESGFQSGHVSGYRDGDWREILTQEQQDKMHTILGNWLEQNGYL